jgi:hypothetical protein
MLTRPLMLLLPPINRGRFHAREVGEKKPKKNYPNTSLSLKKGEGKKKTETIPFCSKPKKPTKHLLPLHSCLTFW